MKQNNQQLGYIHLYTGNGKGKTTAAFGVVLRALFAGYRVYVGQFVKSMKYHEVQLESLFPTQLTIEQLGSGCYIFRNPSEEDVRLAHEGLHRCATILASGEYNLVVLDELTIATYYHLIEVDAVVKAIEARAPHTEVIITGRYAPPQFVELAHLVTDMQEVKHYYTEGVLSRAGIDK